MGDLGRFRHLHPSDVGNLLVAPGFPVPRRGQAPPERANTNSFREFYSRECILGELSVPGTDEHLAFIDKAFPHSRYDLMILVSNDDVRCSPCDFSEKTLAVILSSVEDFVEYIGRPDVIQKFGLEGSRVTFGINHDRHTADRQNGQFFDKRFHLHLNCWPKHDLGRLRPVRLASIPDHHIRQSMVDPVAFLGPAVLYDALRDAFVRGRLADAEVIVPDGGDMRDGLPLGLKFKVPGWDYLSDARGVELIRTLHATAESAYRDVHLAFTGEEPSGRPWYRPDLLDEPVVARNLRSIGYLTERTRAHLGYLRHNLSSVSPDEMDIFRGDPSIASRKLALAGLDYHMGVFSPRENSIRNPLRDSRDVYLYMQFKILNRHGGGPALNDAITVQVDRSQGPVLSESELDLRRLFAEGYVSSRLASLSGWAGDHRHRVRTP